MFINHQERVKDVPVLSSSVYGHRVYNPIDPPGRQSYQPLDIPERKHSRIAHVQAEFYRRNKIEGLEIPLMQ